MTSILTKLRALAAELDQAQRALLDVRTTRASDDQVR
jgi:hypothetical protein